MTRALVSGSFDPVTRGHVDIIARAAALFSEVRVVIFVNPDKKCLYTIDERLTMLKQAGAPFPNVSVGYAGGYVADYVRKNAIDCIVRGIRSENDLAYETEMARYNKKNGGVDTVFFAADPAYADLSSTKVRETVLHHGDASAFLPENVRLPAEND